ncbi:MAG: hypothetical protein M0005_08910 [Actinomycetota bacterium]|jgi:beta-mannosidase|nr:hypothetical protein [Actinomycetota bacterium]
MGAPGQDLGGRWAAMPSEEALRRSFPAPEFDDSCWHALSVPGHWRQEPAFAGSDGPVLYRRSFDAAPLSAGERAWLVMEGVFYQSDVWLDGSYLGDTEGYFFPHEFEVTSLIGARREHLAAIEVSSPAGRDAGRALLGSWADPGCIDPAYNPGGIWAPVRLATTGPVHIASLRLACPEATKRRAVLQLSAVFDSALRGSAEVVSEAWLVTGNGPAGPSGAVVASATKRLPLIAGHNRASWHLEIPSPELWWPAGLGGQRLYEVAVRVEAGGGPSDSRVLRTGLRQVRMGQMSWQVNGERVFLRGADLVPTRRDPAGATRPEIAREVGLALEAGLNLLRVHDHVGRSELYDAADGAGLLLWQDLPSNRASRWVARRQAVRQAHKAVGLLGHHPSVVAWSAGADYLSQGKQGIAPALRVLPRAVAGAPGSWLADAAVRRAFDRADRSRPALVHPGTAGFSRLVPRPANAAGLLRMASLWPSAVRFVALRAATAVPEEASFMTPARWPELDWEQLEGHFGLDRAELLGRFPPASYASFEAWREATQRAQAQLVRSGAEALRRLRSHPAGGFCVHRLNDTQPAVSCSLLGHDRRPKAAWLALAGACSPLLAVASWPAPAYPAGTRAAFDLHVVNDLSEDQEDLVFEARATWPGGGTMSRFAGRAPKASCRFVGRFVVTLPSRAELDGKGAGAGGERGDRSSGGPGAAQDETAGSNWLRLQLVLWRAGEVVSTNSYESRVTLW